MRVGCFSFLPSACHSRVTNIKTRGFFLKHSTIVFGMIFRLNAHNTGSVGVWGNHWQTYGGRLGVLRLTASIWCDLFCTPYIPICHINKSFVQVENPEKLRRLKAQTLPTEAGKAFEAKRQKALKEMAEESRSNQHLLEVGKSLRKSADDKAKHGNGAMQEVAKKPDRKKTPDTTPPVVAEAEAKKKKKSEEQARKEQEKKLKDTKTDEEKAKNPKEESGEEKAKKRKHFDVPAAVANKKQKETGSVEEADANPDQERDVVDAPGPAAAQALQEAKAKRKREEDPGSAAEAKASKTSFVPDCILLGVISNNVY